MVNYHTILAQYAPLRLLEVDKTSERISTADGDEIMSALTARELDLTTRLAAAESEAKVRAEFQRELTPLRDDLGDVKGQVKSLQDDVTALKSGVGNVTETLTKMEKTLNSLSNDFSTISHVTEEVQRDTADGVQLTKKFKMYKSVFGDFKKPITWLWAGIATVSYKFLSALAAAHGITFAALIQAMTKH